MLVEHCYECHSSGTEEIAGKLLLDSAPAVIAGGESGAAIVPGSAKQSLIISALLYDDFQMPPDQQLSDEVIAHFEKWINDGAYDPRDKATHLPVEGEIDYSSGREFWAFIPPRRSKSLRNIEVMDGRAAIGARVDALIDRGLERSGIKPNPTADRRTLIRRLSFDILGLPPTADEVEQFVQDTAPDAYERLVDRHLSSPSYGPRWARMWLDVMRFAEDQAHIVGNNKSLFFPDAWRYRDWVVDALNSDMPYDRFVQVQLAADLIEPDNDSIQPALGFIGLGPKYYRRNSLEVMAEEWEDRVDVVSRGLLGLTAACARCHDHKYDPIATEDYYALAGVFASTELYNKPIDQEGRARKRAAGEDKNAKEKAPEQSLHIIREGKLQDLAVMIRGKVDNQGEIVPRGFLQVLSTGQRLQFEEGSGRKELAYALTSSNNPLTARVIVNRVWAQYFGVGLVSTPSNFGSLGARPTHPELLDDLAVRFMENGWSLKWLHRQIVLSKAYQRSSSVSENASAIDPANKLLWRMPRRRLPIESWRDAVLHTAGNLNFSGGESIAADDPSSSKRTVYSAVSRFELNPMLARFDFPDPNVHSARRVETNTPLQKLFLLNSPFVLQQADVLASILKARATEPPAQVAALYRQTLQREPTADESRLLSTLASKDTNGLTQAAQTLLISNEFWYLD